MEGQNASLWATAPSTERQLFGLYKPSSVLSSGGNEWQRPRLLDISSSMSAFVHRIDTSTLPPPLPRRSVMRSPSWADMEAYADRPAADLCALLTSGFDTSQLMLLSGKASACCRN